MWTGLITMAAFVTITWAIGRSVWSWSHSLQEIPSPYELDEEDAV